MLYITQEIDQKRFMYLHKILQRNDNHWTKMMLNHLKNTKIGWANSIQNKLTDYGLEENWEEIKTLSKPAWKRVVKTAVMKKNKEKLIQNFISREDQIEKIKTKTAYFYNNITSES